MKRSLRTGALGAAMVFSAVTSQGANAASLLIDPTGTGSGGSAITLTGIGSSFGNFLADNALSGSGANTAAGGTTVYGQNAIYLDFGGGDFELTILFSIPMTASLSGAATTAGTVMSLAQFGAGTFSMWFDSTPEGVSPPSASSRTQQVSGVGYGDGVLILSGDITVVPPMDFTNSSGTSTLDIDPPSGGYPATVDTITGTGSATLNVNLTFQDDDYVINNVTNGDLNLTLTNALRLEYTNAAGNHASTMFDDATLAPTFGADLDNNFTCGEVVPGAASPCDFQAQMNTTFTFFETPEPGTVALLGVGLTLVGGMRARRRSKAA
jgi:hypothetical protein